MLQVAAATLGGSRRCLKTRREACTQKLLAEPSLKALTHEHKTQGKHSAKKLPAMNAAEPNRSCILASY